MNPTNKNFQRNNKGQYPPAAKGPVSKIRKETQNLANIYPQSIEALNKNAWNMNKNKGNKINKRISPTTTPVDLKYYRQTNNDNTILNIKKEIPSKK